MSDYKIETGARMLELRKKNNKSQSDVAKYLGLTVAAYQNYETGRREAGYEVLANLADFYGVSTDLLLGRAKSEQTTIDKLASEFNMSAFEKKIFEGYVNLPKEMRSDLMEFLHKAVAETMEESSDTEIETTDCGKLEDDARTPQEKDAI